MSEKLKPCPFCGAPAELNVHTSAGLWPSVSVSCTNYSHCGASIDDFISSRNDDDTYNDKFIINTIRRWNRRYRPKIRRLKSRSERRV